MKAVNYNHSPKDETLLKTGKSVLDEKKTKNKITNEIPETDDPDPDTTRKDPEWDEPEREDNDQSGEDDDADKTSEDDDADSTNP